MRNRTKDTPEKSAANKGPEPGANGKGAAEANGKCRHYWVIESPEGPVSIGRCKNCGAVKEFQNYAPISTWSDDKSPAIQPSRSSNFKTRDEPVDN